MPNKMTGVLFVVTEVKHIGVDADHPFVKVVLGDNHSRFVDGAWKEEASFFTCVARNGAARTLLKTHPGWQIWVEGHLFTHSWKDKEKKIHEETRLYIDRARFMRLNGKKKEEEQEEPTDDQS